MHSVTKTVSVASDAYFSATTAQANDTVQYKVAVKNTGLSRRPYVIAVNNTHYIGTSPIYNLLFATSVSSWLTMQAANDGLDNDGNLIVDDLSVESPGIVSGAGGTITYSLNSLAAGVTQTFTFYARVAMNVPIGTIIDSINANASGYALPVNTTCSSRIFYQATGSATLSTPLYTVVVTETATSEPTSTGTNVLIGEQIQYNVTHFFRSFLFWT